jgi:hypothetical protein
MGSMSASDAAPLPRLGEVYFDVRGESRSMRLSWYADTGVAVFSIWQGGTCTGTFRLPIADLPRMVAALQRGPHGDARGPRDARGTAEQQGRTDQRGGHAREPRPEPDTGYSDPGYSGPYAGPPAAYGEEPAPDYPDRPGQGRRAEPATEAYREGQGDEYRRTGAHGRHEEEARQGYRDDSLPGGYRGEPGGGYRGQPGGGYRSEPGGYRGEPGGYRGEPGGYRSEPGGGYEDEPTGVYRSDPLAPGYQDEPGTRYRETGYPDDPLTGRYPAEDPLTGRYPAEDPLTGRYPAEDPLTGRHPAEDPQQARYQDDSLTGRYHEDPHPARYPEDPPAGDYPDGPHTEDYPGGAGAAGYPDDLDSQDYPASSGNAGYSPARPYVAPVPGGSGPAAEGRGQGRRRAVRGEEGDPSPDSFPYGQPPAEREARGRGR